MSFSPTSRGRTAPPTRTRLPAPTSTISPGVEARRQRVGFCSECLSGLWPSEAQATSGEALQGRLRLLGPLRFGDARGELFEHRSLPPSPCSPALRRPATPRAGSSNRVLALKHDAGSSDVAWDW